MEAGGPDIYLAEAYAFFKLDSCLAKSRRDDKQ